MNGKTVECAANPRACREANILPPRKGKIGWLIQYLTRQAFKQGVEF